ncbi:MAG: hypothetical protein R2819_10410 [Allomuricauda sp.]
MTCTKSLIMVALATLMVSLATANTIKEPSKDLDLDSVPFIEEDHDCELGFDTAQYLPENFDPYSGQITVGSINYIDENDEIEIGFETAGYLPLGFDPYER